MPGTDRTLEEIYRAATAGAAIDRGQELTRRMEMAAQELTRRMDTAADRIATEYSTARSTFRTEYQIDGKQFDGWESVADSGDIGFGCRWPFAPCGQLAYWARIVYLDATDHVFRKRIPYETLCEIHWMNRGQLCLDIPEPEPVKVPDIPADDPPPGYYGEEDPR